MSAHPIRSIDLSNAAGGKVERLALNLRAYAYGMGAPRRDTDEEVALGAARLILPALENTK